jgi:DNA modification methylase
LGADLKIIGFTDEELTQIMQPGGAAGLTDPDDAPPVPEVPVTVLGDLWVMGGHRLFCGDCTSADNVDRLLQSSVPFLCVTDPPYGVNYDPGWRNVEAAKGNLAYAASRIGKVANDDRSDWHEAWGLFPGDVIYSWHPPGATSLVHAKALQDSGFTIRMQIIWAKSNFQIGRGDYHVRHEPCWYAVRKDKASRRTDDRTQTTLWQINLDKNVEGGHSTQKPVECMERAIKNHIAEGIYDPFVGSGTTIIASERQSRRCYAMEIEPHYVDVAVERWQNFTGKAAVLEGDGRTFNEIKAERLGPVPILPVQNPDPVLRPSEGRV